MTPLRQHRPFVVTGTPRSGTAWLAAFLNTGRVHCSHEILWTSAGWASFYAEFLKHPCSGTVDSGLLPYLAGVRVDLDPRVLLVRRDREEVLDSFERIELPRSAMQAPLDRALRQMDYWRLRPGVMEIAYPDLHSPLVMEKVWAHLTGDLDPFPRERHAQMVPQRIERDPAEMMSIAAEALQRGFPPRFATGVDIGS